MGETVKTHLIDVYVSNKYNRQTDVYTKYMAKGNTVEEDSITLICRNKKLFLQKNDEQLSNNWIKGSPDLFEGVSIQNAEIIRDAKSSWDIYSFMRNYSKDLNKLYEWQVTGYMDLTGASLATINYCLVNTPASQIDDEKRKAQWRLSSEFISIDKGEGKEAFEEECRRIERNHIFDYDLFVKHNPNYDLLHTRVDWMADKLDIPAEERHLEFVVERNDANIMLMHSRVEEARKWLNDFEAGRLAAISEKRKRLAV